jgi:hypothetical protein
VTDIPPGLRVSAWYGDEHLPRLNGVPAERILAQPVTVAAAYAGPRQGVDGGAEAVIRFSFALTHPGIAGRSADGLAAIATQLAGHLASLDDEWPSEAAMVHLCLPPQPPRAARHMPSLYEITPPDWDVIEVWLEEEAAVTA